MRHIARHILLGLLLVLTTLPASAAGPSLVRVRIQTSLGPIIVEVDTRRAPITANNFLAYVDEKRFDNMSFYRAARNKGDPKRGLVQGGINSLAKRGKFPIAHEPTSKTGLRHVDGTISMARHAPGTARGDFFVVVGAAPFLDARPGGDSGYAAFGRVVSGMPIVHRILAAPTYPGGRSMNTIGQHMINPVKIVSVTRVK